MPLGERVDLTHVPVSQAQQPARAVDLVGDHGGRAQVGQVEVRLEVGIAHQLADALGGRGEVVESLEVHGESLPAGAGRRHGNAVS